MRGQPSHAMIFAGDPFEMKGTKMLRPVDLVCGCARCGTTIKVDLGKLGHAQEERDWKMVMILACPKCTRDARLGENWASN